ncbi:type 2 lanthipeptide synthetase LanM family protein [Dendronalium sp. ChiSLP03b]|uniref:type 2 lanthipeptide synthetase LanM family protein n=1 Tax=Dendronalium sp. ChiSLP03b TaxID=3075381 RepID=UPI002AD417C6|nr:type 2 lanthipeptide synthetase LanM family protein [Dendronalium sp. ChiSLP03b]MDZ8207495.1 type 2 lanthipeptide synthetase LanM family protein [Dendronalium sp. ChiSLP03b]
MSQISMPTVGCAYAPPVNCTHAELAAIVANASFLWERLDPERFTVDGEQANESEIDRRCDRWCQVVAQGNLDTLEKRLQWEGLNLDTVRPRLGSVQITGTQPLPEWAQTLQQIMQTATEFMSASESFLPIDPDKPIPFEDVLLPAIIVARQQLLTRLGSGQLTQDTLPLSILSKAAYQALEQSLLQRLAALCTKTLDFEFSQVRPFGQNLLNLLGLETEDSNSKSHYTQFVYRLLQDGLLTFFQKYPVLGRLVATAVNFWVEFVAEFLQRLAEDTDILHLFSSTIDSLGKVTEIETSLSDPHKQGRTVILLTFESGLKLVYKPKDLGLEVAFNQFLTWCDQHSQLLDFKIIQVLNQNGYGWVEYVEHQPCVDEAAAERFYQRAGMLLCVLYALRGTDCHCENLIASGEHLVLIDMETLLHHEANLIENSPFIQEFETAAAQRLWDSVLRTGLLPRWDFSSDRRVAYDISGLGSTDSGQAPRKMPRWQAINTDNMHQRYESVPFPLEKNVPRLGEIALSTNDYQVQIAAGFEQMCRFLMVNKDRLLAPDSPLAAMQNQQVRFIFRATQIYGTILQNAWAPDYLKNGADYSIELDRLSYAFLVAQEKPHAWPILTAELQAMEQLDIPFFTASAGSDELSVGSNQAIGHYFKQPSYQQVLSQLQALDETDLSRQVAIIQGSYYAKMAQTSSKNEGWDVESLPVLNSQQLIEEAKAIATELEARAIPDPDGSVNWIGLVYIPEAERFQLQVLNDSLYDGRCGVALFLAALSQVSGELRFRNLTLQTLQSLRSQIQIDPESQQRKARLMGIGGASGLGSTIYTFVKISQFLGDETLLQDAQALSDWMTPELIAADKYLDIISGAAGAILGLLSLYGVTKQATVLEKAIACGQHLLTHQVSHEGAPKAWLTIGEMPFTGFSHGAAGISYALLQLYAVTQDCNYLEAALEGIEYERSVFSNSNANWPDFRGLAQTGQPVFPTQWCHGAAGIGLARLGSFEIVKTSEIEREIEIALQTTQRYALQVIDHLCCGNLGRVEVLLVGAQRCSRPDWYQAAFQNATNVVAKAQRTGAYQLFPNLPNSVFNPGFFPGTAGIGYQLLRLAQPEQLPSVLLWE